METKRYKNWWLLALNGVIAILAGILFLFFTDDAIKTVMQFFGGILLVVGIAQAAVTIINMKKDKNIVPGFFLAVLYLALGSFILVSPETAQNIFLRLVGVWAAITGIFQLIILVNVRKELPNKNVILFNGLLTIILGILMIVKPDLVAGFVGKVFGLLLLVFGVVMIYLSLMLRKLTSSSKRPDEI
jgi:uncharacterized membrane protein HdeD (DUF308 family)